MISYNTIGHGTYLRAYEFATNLARLGHSITLIGTAPSRRTSIKTWEEWGIKIIETPSFLGGPFRSGFDPIQVAIRQQWVKNKQFDIVHGFETRPTVIYPALELQKKGIPLVVDWCDWFGKGGSVEERPNPLLRTLLRPVETYFENHFRRMPSATTVICSTLKQRAVDLGVKPESIHLLPNGLDLPEWKIWSRIEARKRFGLNDSQHVIGYIGSLFPKDLVLMKQAFANILAEKPNVHLLHLGSSNYDLRSSDIDPETVTITGRISEEELQQGLTACDLCWLPMSDIPANKGRSPLKFTNYLAAGKPIVITNVGDLPEMIQRKQAGRVTDPAPEALAQGVLSLISDPDACNTLGLNAKKLSQNPEYSWFAQSQKLLAIYQELIH